MDRRGGCSVDKQWKHNKTRGAILVATVLQSVTCGAPKRHPASHPQLWTTLVVSPTGVGFSIGCCVNCELTLRTATENSQPSGLQDAPCAATVTLPKPGSNLLQPVQDVSNMLSTIHHKTHTPTRQKASKLAWAQPASKHHKAACAHTACGIARRGQSLPP